MINARREAAKAELGQFIAGLVMTRMAAVKAGGGGNDPVSRLIRISLSGDTKFGIADVMVNAGGLLIGAVETTSHCAINVLSELFARPEMLAAAQAAARDGDPEAVDGFAMEALRFRPAFPWFFRMCIAATELAGGTVFVQMAASGTTMLALACSAITDAAGFPEPRRFDAERRQGDNLLFGHGIHECLGRAIARPMPAEIVRQILLLPGLRLDGPISLSNGVPEAAAVAWDA
jgi:cytochrome P450